MQIKEIVTVAKAGGLSTIVEVTIDIDRRALAKRLASQAYHNKSKRATFAHGLINAYVAEGQHVGE